MSLLLAASNPRGVAFGGATASPRMPLTPLKNQGMRYVKLRLPPSGQTQSQSESYGFVDDANYARPLSSSHGERRLAATSRSSLFRLPRLNPDHQTLAGRINRGPGFPCIRVDPRFRDYNSNCIAAFQSTSTAPRLCAIGNEVASSLLWSDQPSCTGGSDVTGAIAQTRPVFLGRRRRGLSDARHSSPAKIIGHIVRPRQRVGASASISSIVLIGDAGICHLTSWARVSVVLARGAG